MAILVDKSQGYEIDFAPVVPSIEGPNNSYNLTLRSQGLSAFRRHYAVDMSSPDGHWYVWRLFRAFQFAEAMATQRTSLNITGRRDDGLNEPATVSVDCGWIAAVLWSDVIPQRHSVLCFEKRSRIDFYCSLNPQQEGEPLLDFRRFVIICQSKEAVEFGNALEIECREALRLRRELGITVPADDYIDS